MSHLANYRASLEPGSGFVDDLASLTTLDESNLLRELQTRYDNNIIYTYIGDILIALNPYKQIHIYGPETRIRYKDVTVRSALPPHLYALSDRAYSTMRSTGRAQCCVVSGESGAGKTESTKLLVEHLIDLCRHRENDIQERIIQVNPLLEAFGNATTVINDNSSRFGKYIELIFDNKGSVLGAQISEYLLEKSRVVSQGPREQNFHIFYYMFAGLNEDQLRMNLLNQPETHRILRNADNSPVYSSEGQFMFCKDMWNNLTHLMAVVGLKPEEVDMILALLAAILHIADIEFERDYETDGVFVKQEEMMELAAILLAVNAEELAAALISNVTFLRGERIVSLKNHSLADDGRDALAKALYGRLFGWIVRQINLILQPDRRVQMTSTIGILDIAGFENFPTNSFEQLCINTANEQLQFYFNQHIFQWELDEYKKEGVKAKDVKYADNKGMIEMFLESHTGFYALLDEESRFPKSTDQTLLDKLAKNLNKRSQFKPAKGRDLSFTINHYAGQVIYRVEGFLEKNRDTLSLNLSECMRNSESNIVCDLFTANISDTGSLMSNPNAPKRTRKSVLLCKDKDFTYARNRSLSKRASKMVKDKSRPAQRTASNAQREGPQVKTLGAHFRNSLTHLMTKLLDAEPCFIRCIKPNSMKQAGSFVTDLISKQLKYTGILETVRIRKMGYPTRIPHHIFIERYRILSFPFTQQLEATPLNCIKLLKSLNISDYAMGKTKVFLRYWHLEQLNLLMNNFGWKIVKCQKRIRGFIARRQYEKMRQLARQDVAALRGFCVYLQKESDDKLHYMLDEQRHDQTRYHEQVAKKKANFARTLQPTPFTSMVSSQSPPPLKSPPAVASKPNIMPPSSPGIPKQPIRRQSLSKATRRPSRENEYMTETLASTKKLSIDVNNASNPYARPSSIVLPQTPPPVSDANQAFYVSILGESVPKIKTIDGDVWGKLYYMERDTNCAKLYLRHSNILIDDSEELYDGQCIGIGAFGNVDRTKEAAEAISKIGKGVRLWRDFQGSIFAERLSDGAEVIVKGYQDPINYCIPNIISDQNGRVLRQSVKIYDIEIFKQHLAYAIQKGEFDEMALQRLSVVSLSFVRNTFDDHKTPCWISVLNFCALDMLGNKYVLDDMIKNYNIKLNASEDYQLKTNWLKMRRRDEQNNSLLADNYIKSSPAAREISTQSSTRDRSRNMNGADNHVRSSSPGYSSSIQFDSQTDGATLMPRK